MRVRKIVFDAWVSLDPTCNPVDDRSQGNRPHSTHSAYFCKTRPHKGRKGAGRTGPAEVPSAAALRKGDSNVPSWWRHRDQGARETKLETDRRRIRDRISHLEKDIEDVARHQDQRRSRRLRQALPILSIVGYTNAGKSTLINTLTHSQVPAQNRLFETLDITSRRLRFPHDREVIVTDTVGFIRNLHAVRGYGLENRRNEDSSSRLPQLR